MNYRENYNHWLSFAECEQNLSEKEIEDRFYKDLEFGTGGLRGLLGAGTNRMNTWTVAKASQGLASYLCEHYSEGQRSIAISYDSRIQSDAFAKVAAEVFAENGIKVHIYPQLMPTPVLSFTTRYLGCSAGIMITASHNPSRYNGYKVYGADGCQITTEAAKEIQAKISEVDISSVKRAVFEKELEKEQISWIGTEVYDAFIDAVKQQSVETEKDIKIIYTPLNGTGLGPVTRILKETGFQDVMVVEEQKHPDGNFPTCPYPNPEIREAMALGLKYMDRYHGDILLATDPDCDRVGIAVKDGSQNKLMTGNQVGALLVDFLVRDRRLKGTEAVVKTIVTNDLGAEIAKKHGVSVYSVLTGFKFIGERIGQFEEKGNIDFLMGYEESYGYLAGTHARDKDAVVASMLICEMAAYWRQRGKTLLDRLQEIFSEYGYYKDALDSYTLEGKTGLERIGQMMDDLRSGEPLFDGEVVDYSKPVPAEDGFGYLPVSNVLKYLIPGGSWIAVRPSGTEPKIKIYYSIRETDEVQADKQLNEYRSILKERLAL